MKANTTSDKKSLQEEGNLPRPHWQVDRTTVSAEESQARQRHGAAHLLNPL